MIILPAIDIKSGNVVRLTQGEFDKETKYFDSPADVAQMWKESGIKFLHVVDLDGALKGERINAAAISGISKVLPCELGGGIRSLEDIEKALELGVSRVIIGTAAIKDAGFVANAVEKYGDRIMVSIDAKDGFVATDGWTKTLDVKSVDFAIKMESIGVSTIIYTDIATDGMLQGPNFEELITVNKAVGCNVIASGGVSSLEDIKKLEQLGFYGCIVGKAIYEGKIDIDELTKMEESV